MSKPRYGEPKLSSRFICLHCLKENCVGQGLQRRPGQQREPGHIKDLVCFNKECNGMITKNVEVRYKDYYQNILDYAKEIRPLYYPSELKEE